MHRATGRPDIVAATSKTFRTLARLTGAAPYSAGMQVPRELTLEGLDQLVGFVARIESSALAELRGVSCLPLSLVAPTRRGVAVTRSFGRPVTAWAEMREAIAHHAARDLHPARLLARQADDEREQIEARARAALPAEPLRLLGQGHVHGVARDGAVRIAIAGIA